MSPRFRLVKRFIDEGKMGRLYYLEGDYNYGRIHKLIDGWRGKLDFYSVVHGGGVHIVDLLLWLSGERIIEVMAYGNNIVSESTGFSNNDLVACLLKFEGGAVGKITANFGCVFAPFS